MGSASHHRLTYTQVDLTRSDSSAVSNMSSNPTVVNTTGGGSQGGAHPTPLPTPPDTPDTPTGVITVGFVTSGNAGQGSGSSSS